jgi:lipoprotein-anchoring transpeptidase ErfK/SrfK
MNAELLQAQRALQNAREALRDGDRNSARRWAEQAAKLAPQLEDPWLILAAVASPKASVAFIERALQINPDSPRARKGMQWALRRLQEVPPGSGGEARSEQKKIEETTQQTKAVKRSARSAPPKKKPRRVAFYPILFLVLGCVVVLAAAWTASTSPVLASILGGTSQASEAEHPQVWARVEIAKPAQTSGLAAEVAEVEPTLPVPSPTFPPPTLEPTTAPPTATLEAPVQSDSEVEPAITPEATSTPAGSLVMDFVEDTPVPTAGPTEESAPAKPQDPPPVGNGEHWIEVNLTQQRVYAWEGDALANSFLVSTGTWATPTVTGTFHIWNKTRIQDMSGPGYYLPDVPFVMYFYKDYGFHGTYWHNNFGTPMSHGCVNLTIPDSEWLYNWASYGTTVKVHY